MSSLYQIRQDHLSLLAAIEDEEGILTEDQSKLLTLNGEDFDNKAISYAYVIKKSLDEAATIKNEIERLSKLKKSAENKAERFKAALDESMIQFGKTEVKTELIKISYRPSKALEVVEGFEDNVLKFINIKMEISKDKVKEAKDNKEEIPDLVTIIDYLKLSAPSLDKKGITDAIKLEGIKIAGIELKEKKNLQIK